MIDIGRIQTVQDDSSRNHGFGGDSEARKSYVEHADTSARSRLLNDGQFKAWENVGKWVLCACDGFVERSGKSVDAVAQGRMCFQCKSTKKRLIQT
jgi:hypothetical protein